MHTAIRLLPGMLLLSWVASARADLLRSPGQVIFPDQLTFTTSAPKATTFTNNGNEALTVVSVMAASGVYARAGGSCGAAPFSIAPQASCTIEHTFTPTAVQSFYQTLRVTLAGGEFVDFGLAGDGNVGYLVISPGTLNFNSAPVGTVGAELTASLYNDRPVPTQITQIFSSSVPAVSAFVRTGGSCSPPPIQFAPFDNCTVTYTFMPAQVGQSTLGLDFLGSSGTFSLYMLGDGFLADPIFDDGFEAPTPIQ